jgi:hypothetical protein
VANALTMFDPAQVPAYITDFLDDPDNNNITSGLTVPTLSPGGKKWTITVAGNKNTLMKRDENGDEVPVSVMRVIVLDYNKDRGRAYYEGTFDAGETKAPVCWSEDGKTADPSVDNPFDDWTGKCDGCPMSVKGSKVTDNNKQGYACSQHRLLAVAATAKGVISDAVPPMRLKLAITSDWDSEGKDQQAQGWFAFRQYLDFLRARGVTNTATVITKMKFDNSENFPKVLFSVDGWVSKEVLAHAMALRKEPDTLKLLSRADTPEPGAAIAAPAAKPKPKPSDDDDDEDAPVVTVKPKAAPPKAAAKPVVAPDDDDEIILPGKASPAADAAKPVNAPAATDRRAAAVAKAQAEADAAKAAKAKAKAVSDDDAGEVVLSGKGGNKPQTATAKPAAGKAKPAHTLQAPGDDDDEAEAPTSTNIDAPAGIEDLVQEWDD